MQGLGTLYRGSAALRKDGAKVGSDLMFGRSAILGPLWLIFSFGRGAGGSPDFGDRSITYGVVLSAANTIGRAAIPAATGSRVTLTPAIEAVAASAAGRRAASAAARSTTQPTTATDSKGSLLMPRPWISIRPFSACAGRTSRLPDWPITCSRSSPTRRVNGSSPCDGALIRFQASNDLPEPDGPRMRTAFGPARTAVA